MKVFWDTNLFIYLIEKHPDWHLKVLARFERHQQQNEQVITSTLTLGELMTQPIRKGQSHLALQYVEILTHGNIGLVSFDAAASERYAQIRATTSLRQPGAIQLACAAAAGARLFVTNNQRLWGMRFAELVTIEGP